TTGHLQRALEKYGAKAADVKTVLAALAATRAEIVEKDGGGKVEPPPDPNMAVVSGHVMLKGKPLTYGFVTFVDQDGKRFSANIQKDGKYVFKKGFPPGKYKVLIEDTPTPPEAGEVRAPIPAAFQTVETTPLTYEAMKGKAEGNFNLQ